MAVYMVERNLPGITPEQLAAAQQEAILTGQRFSADGKEVRYIRSTYIPGEERCMCLFEAPNREWVKEVNAAAQLPFTRIVEALDLTPWPSAAEPRNGVEPRLKQREPIGAQGWGWNGGRQLLSKWHEVGAAPMLRHRGPQTPNQENGLRGKG